MLQQGQRVGLQGPRALTEGTGNNIQMSHKTETHVSNSHPTHLGCLPLTQTISGKPCNHAG